VPLIRLAKKRLDAVETLAYQKLNVGAILFMEELAPSGKNRGAEQGDPTSLQKIAQNVAQPIILPKAIHDF
jgi:hypothetical protein